MAIFKINSPLTIALDMFLTIYQVAQPRAGRIRLSWPALGMWEIALAHGCRHAKSRVRGSLALSSHAPLGILDSGILLVAVKTRRRSRKKNAVAIAILPGVATVEKSLMELLREGSMTATARQI